MTMIRQNGYFKFVYVLLSAYFKCNSLFEKSKNILLFQFFYVLYMFLSALQILHECSCIIEFITRCGKQIKCSTSLAIHLFYPTRLINAIKHEHSCKTLYYLQTVDPCKCLVVALWIYLVLQSVMRPRLLVMMDWYWLGQPPGHVWRTECGVVKRHIVCQTTVQKVSFPRSSWWFVWHCGALS